MPTESGVSVSPTPEQLADAAERTRDLAAFARGAVHDLRNPLNVMVANVYLLRQRLADAEPRTTKPVERIADQVKGVETILGGYLAFDQVAHPSLQPTQLNEVVQAVRDSLIVTEGCEVVLGLSPDLPAIRADSRLLETVIRGLIRNSVRAMGSEGTITISTACSSEGVALSVADSGPGISDADLPRVFEPFFSTWEEHAGLGLPLAALTAQAHGGGCVLQTAPGAGTRVEIRFPT